MTHYHYGHGLAGYGPEAPDTCRTLTCLAMCVREELERIADVWRDQAYAARSIAAQMRALRPASGADPTGYPGSWESIADGAMRALECLDGAEEAENLWANLDPGRERAPLYRDAPDLWQAELYRQLPGSGAWPISVSHDGYQRFYVWQCDCAEWEHSDYPHHPGYLVGCTACESRCHCDGEAAQCVFEGEHDV